MNCDLFLASIVESRTEEDDRLTVRILPQMKDLPERMCPRWPFFFRGKVFAGKKGEKVWVVCNTDFSQGYILGFANYNTYSNEYFKEGRDFETKDRVTLSIPYETLQSKIESTSVDLIGQTIDFQNIEVTFWNEESVHFVERDTGGSIIAFSTGTLYIMRPDAFVVSIAGKNSIKLDSNGFSVQGKAIKLQSSKVTLGTNPVGHVMVSNGVKANAAMTSSSVKA